MANEKVNRAEKLSRFSETWSPPIVGDHFAELLLLEPASTLNTGDVRNERTVQSPGLL